MTGLSHLGVSSLLSYVVAVLLPAFDALIPLVPSETAVIALGVATAGSADPRAAVLVALAACGAFLGDNAAYLIGRRFGPAAERRIFAGERGARRRAWAERSLQRFGARMIIGCRFIPGGRTAVTLTCGLVGYSRRRFVAATAVASVIWASYAFLIGRLGGKAFEDQPWLGLLLALGVTVAISVVIEAVRRARAWRLNSRAAAAAAAESVHTVCTPAAPGLHPARLSWSQHQAGGRGGQEPKDAAHAVDATAYPGRNAVAELAAPVG